jgi:hypothetical protein
MMARIAARPCTRVLDAAAASASPMTTGSSA